MKLTRSRRGFIKNSSAMIGATLTYPLISCKSKQADMSGESLAKNSTSIVRGDLNDFGIQLYSLRDDMPKDPKGILKQVADFGYTQIEGYEGGQGMFWGMSNKDFKMYLDDIGLQMVSSHCDVRKDFEQKVDQAAEIGVDYLICPYVGPQKSMDDWKKITDMFNDCGEKCRKGGIKFAYHNHAYSFKAFSGMIPHDYIMDNTDPENVLHEMDIYWVVTGGADPKEYLKKYSGRFTLCHVKDRMKDAEEDFASCNLGTGVIDFPSILKVAKENGMKYFIAEQEKYDQGTPLECMQAGAEYMKKLKFA